MEQQQAVQRSAPMPSAEGSTPQNAEGVSKRLKLSRTKWNAEYRAKRERIYTVLTIDGGGMRGMIPGKKGQAVSIEAGAGVESWKSDVHALEISMLRFCSRCIQEQKDIQQILISTRPVTVYLSFFAAALPAACVLEEVEIAIKEKALTLLKESIKVGASAEQEAGFKAIFQLEPPPAVKDIPNLTYDDIHVDLADFFDLISGTAATGMPCAQCCPVRFVCHNHLLGHACLHVSEHLRCLQRQ